MTAADAMEFTKMKYLHDTNARCAGKTRSLQWAIRRLDRLLREFGDTWNKAGQIAVYEELITYKEMLDEQR